jgi:AraC-like DNA-binding protein
MARSEMQPATDPALAAHVASLTVVRRDPATADQVYTLPRGQATLVFCLRSGDPLDEQGAVRDGEGVLRFLGPATRSYSKRIIGVPQTIVVRFRAGCALPFVKVPMHALADGMSGLDELIGEPARRLARAMTLATSTAGRLAMLENFLLAQLANSSARTLRRGLQVAQAVPGALAHGRSAQEDPTLSDRQLRRLFNDYVGLSPHTVQRIERFSHAARFARGAPDARWGALAAQLGYYDQAHMIGEFREFVGVTPGHFLPALSAGLPHLNGSWFSGTQMARANA